MPPRTGALIPLHTASLPSQGRLGCSTPGRCGPVASPTGRKAGVLDPLWGNGAGSAPPTAPRESGRPSAPGMPLGGSCASCSGTPERQSSAVPTFPSPLAPAFFNPTMPQPTGVVQSFPRVVGSRPVTGFRLSQHPGAFRERSAQSNRTGPSGTAERPKRRTSIC